MSIKRQYDREFNDLSECTEYYFDEIGKLEDMGDRISKKTRKKLKAYYESFLLMNIGTEDIEQRLSNKISKTEAKEYSEEYDAEHDIGAWNKTKKVTKVIFSPFARLFHRKKKPTIEVVELEVSNKDEIEGSEASKMLEQGNVEGNSTE